MAGYAGKLIGNGGNLISTVVACGVSIGTTKDLQLDFGAVGDGIADDSPAFLRAADWINANWSPTSAIELYIPAGTYKVGVQLAPGASFNYGTGNITNSMGFTRMGLDMLKLTNVQNVYIHGDPGLTTQIIYANGLYFGGMKPGGSACNFGACAGCASNELARVGNFISLWDCSCVSIENLSLDGNAQNCTLMGSWGECNGRQLAYDGINIINGHDITIEDTKCMNFGRDGLMTRYTTSNPTNITLTNLECISNCRQGFSFTAGDNIVATNCKFNQTGSIFYNNPGSGMDIEPENGGTCINSSFTNCEFKDNQFVGMISDNHYPDVANFIFDKCEFSATSTAKDSWSIWPCRMINTVFDSCIIRGQFCHVAGTSPTDQIYFERCTITDFDGSFSNQISGWNRYLMNFGASPPDNHYYTFVVCTFDIHHSLLIYTIPSGGLSHTERMYEGNKFIFHHSDMNSTVSYFGSTINNVPYPSLGNFINSRFGGGNRFTETAPTSTPPGSGLYWIGISLSSCGTSYDNSSYNLNDFPQDGVGGNPYTRICFNSNWCGAYAWQRGPF